MSEIPNTKEALYKKLKWAAIAIVVIIIGVAGYHFCCGNSEGEVPVTDTTAVVITVPDTTPAVGADTNKVEPVKTDSTKVESTK